jgi:hypothetical protein
VQVFSGLDFEYRRRLTVIAGWLPPEKFAAYFSYSHMSKERSSAAALEFA